MMGSQDLLLPLKRQSLMKINVKKNRELHTVNEIPRLNDNLSLHNLKNSHLVAPFSTIETKGGRGIFPRLSTTMVATPSSLVGENLAAIFEGTGKKEDKKGPECRDRTAKAQKQATR